MSDLTGFNYGQDVPSVADIRAVGKTARDNTAINAAIQQSAQEFPPAINTGAFFVTQRIPGAYLSPYATKARDAELRLIYRHENNGLFQGTLSSVIKRVVTTPYVIEGDTKRLYYIRGADGRLKSISAIEHFQTAFNDAQFGQGWAVFLSRLLTDFATQDFGGVIELIGPGDPTGPIEGAISGIAHLDAGRCYISGNPYYPMLYFSLLSGSLHRMHASRVVRFVDQPSPDERYFGIGLCALSRAIAVVERQIEMNRFIYERVNDKPTPGIMLWRGLSEEKRNALIQAYIRQQTVDARQPFGNILHVSSVNMDAPLEIQQIAFSQVPEKFDWVAYNSLDVDAIALAFGIDRQEIWELAGRGLGTAAQSQVLAEKARGKMFGFLLQNLERIINGRVLPDFLEFSFKYQDETQQQQKAQQNYQLAQTVQVLTAAGVMNAQQAQQYLSDASDEFKDVFANNLGQISPPDETERDAALEDDNPVNVSHASTAPSAPAATPPASPAKGLPTLKAFGFTSQYFTLKFLDLTRRALKGEIPRSQFENDLVDALSTAGTNAFVDGLRDGGVSDGPDDDEQAQIQDWLIRQIDYIDSLASALYDKSIAPDRLSTRAEMWSNKSLREIRDAGRVAADKNATYKWLLGHTEKHCKDCQRLNGQVHRLKEWHSRGWLPGSDRLECGGYKCQCSLVRTDEKSVGRF